jgi:hypothetical protein
VVTIVRTNPATGAETREQARVLAVNGGVVLQIGSRIEVLRDDGLPVRVIFDKVPPNLRAKPTLSVKVDSDRAGTRPASIRYLTPGLGWSADYVALFDSKAGKVDVQGWVTLTNNSGTTYTNANTLLVAGAVNQSGGRYQPYSMRGPYPICAGAVQHGAGGHRDRQPRAPRRLLSLSRYQGAPRSRANSDQAGELPRCAGRPGSGDLRVHQRLAGGQRRTAECGERGQVLHLEVRAVWAMRSRRARCASI